jgi:hypothetical protein
LQTLQLPPPHAPPGLHTLLHGAPPPQLIPSHAPFALHTRHSVDALLRMIAMLSHALSEAHSTTQALPAAQRITAGSQSFAARQRTRQA